MAKPVFLKQPETGLTKQGYYGFSWTTLFFGPFPALFRADFVTFIGFFVISALLGLVTYGIGPMLLSLVWAFMYNRYYTRKMIEKGYRLSDVPNTVDAAGAALGIARSI